MPTQGRPRHFGVERTPSGRTRRGTGGVEDRRRGQEARAASLRARAQHTGLSMAEVADRGRGHADGPERVLVLRGVFSDIQAEAVWLYRSCWEGYLETIPGPFPACAGMVKRRGRAVDVENAKETARARRCYVRAQAALTPAGRAAVVAISLMAQRFALPPAGDWSAARRGADALVQHFNLHLASLDDRWVTLRRRRRSQRSWCLLHSFEGSFGRT
jgi:hypothetical protein